MEQGARGRDRSSAVRGNAEGRCVVGPVCDRPVRMSDTRSQIPSFSQEVTEGSQPSLTAWRGARSKGQGAALLPTAMGTSVCPTFSGAIAPEKTAKEPFDRLRVAAREVGNRRWGFGDRGAGIGDRGSGFGDGGKGGSSGRQTAGASRLTTAATFDPSFAFLAVNLPWLGARSPGIRQ